jgi:hypothetical protein
VHEDGAANVSGGGVYGMVEGEAAFLHGDMPLARGISGFDYLVPQKSAFSGIRPSGSLAGWKVVIKDNVHGWPQLFALSSSLASTLLGMAGMDVALFHFYGGSTTGKNSRSSGGDVCSCPWR